jgi:protocatechuate 3,4-dioxygenase beta subunit
MQDDQARSISDGSRRHAAPHIHFEIEGQIDRKVTLIFFPNEPLNDQDRHLNSVRRPETLIAKFSSTSASSELVAHWDIVLTRG